jgi:putative DNA primase/helicase
MRAEEIIMALGGNKYSRMCKCPAHDDRTPSLHVSDSRDGKVLVRCHAGCSQDAVIEALKAKGISLSGKPSFPVLRTKWDPDKLSPEQEEAQRFRKACEILYVASHRGGGPPIAYLKGRGINVVPTSAMLLPAKEARQLTGIAFPAMVLPIAKGDRLCGAQATYLDSDGSSKASGLEKGRRFYGAVKGGYIQLALLDDDKPTEKLIVGEGVETTLSAMQISDLPGVSALSAGNMPGVMPPSWQELIIAADNDDPGQKGAKALAERMAQPGHIVRIATPPAPANDWNDVLKAAKPDDFDRLRRLILTAPIFKGSGAVKALGMEEFIDLQFPPRRCLLKPWLTTTGLVMIDAQPGHGKTWLALSVAYAVASGQPLMQWVVEHQGKVLYVDGELPGELLQKRLKELGPPLPESQFAVLSRSQFEMQGALIPNLGDDAGRRYLDAEIERLGTDLIILDSVSTLVRSGIDNDVESWRAIQDWSLTHRARGRSVIYLHHQGRSGKPRGTSSREIVLDTRISLTHDLERSTETETAFTLEFPKAREIYGADTAPMIAYLSTQSGQVEWRRESVRDDTRERVKELLAQGLKPAEVAKEMKLSRGRVSQIKKEIALKEAQLREEV